MNHRLVLFVVSLCAVFMASLSGVSSISVSQLVVPRQVGRGHDTQLHCHFNLGGSVLYTVKWYKGSREFFRVVPGGARPYQVFPHLSNLTVDRSYAGTYGCEVSGEAPDFETDSRQANMSVIDLPLQGPIIINVQTSYQRGEKVSLNCTSAPSNPMAILQWQVDGVQIGEPYVKRYVDGSTKPSKPSSKSAEWNAIKQGDWQSRRESEGDLIDDSVATVGLEFVVELPEQSTGPFAIRQVQCTAFVGEIYRGVTRANLSIVDGRSPKPIATVRTPSRLLHSGGSSGGRSRWSSDSCCCIGLVFCCLLQLITRMAINTRAY